MSDKSTLASIKERYEFGCSAMSSNRERMLEDLRFSNPADPQQWDSDILAARSGAGGGDRRPCLVLDQTNQYIQQEVNNARLNRIGIKAVPVDSKADQKVASHIDGLFRAIEDSSKADLAYDIAAEYQSRIGIGFVRVIPVIIDSASNKQDIRIVSVSDPLAVILDPNWRDCDGSDAMWGQIETYVPMREYDVKYKGASKSGFDASLSNNDTWVSKRGVRILEDFEVTETETNVIEIPSPDGGDTWEISEEKYWEIARAQGTPPIVLNQFKRTSRIVKWRKVNSSEILEETTFPAEYVPIIPFVGTELWVDGERYISGLVRPMRDSQRLYNFERSAYVETVAAQPRTPWTVPIESIDGDLRKYWDKANSASLPYLPYSAFTEDGNQLPPPSRVSPASMSQAFIQGAEIASRDIQASIGRYNGSIGDNPNQQSGVALRAVQRRADVTNAHYSSNRAKSIRHIGRICLQMIGNLYDTERAVRILGEDGTSQMLTVDPTIQSPAVYEGGDPKRKMLAFNPAVGRYDVTVKAGPMYQTRREDAAASLSEIVNGNPQMMAMLGDLWVNMMDIPDGEKVAARFKAMLPPQIQQAEIDESGGQMDIPPQVRAKLQQAEQLISNASQVVQQLQGELSQASSRIEQLESGRDIKLKEMALKDKELDIKDKELGVKDKELDTKAIEALAKQHGATNVIEPRANNDLAQDGGSMERVELAIEALSSQLNSLSEAAFSGNAHQISSPDIQGASVAAILQSIENNSAALRQLAAASNASGMQPLAVGDNCEKEERRTFDIVTPGGVLYTGNVVTLPNGDKTIELGSSSGRTYRAMSYKSS